MSLQVWILDALQCFCCTDLYSVQPTFQGPPLCVIVKRLCFEIVPHNDCHIPSFWGQWIPEQWTILPSGKRNCILKVWHVVKQKHFKQHEFIDLLFNMFFSLSGIYIMRNRWEKDILHIVHNDGVKMFYFSLSFPIISVVLCKSFEPSLFRP